jgi:LmbE family N-acetylglucosaminyl deacetylase
MSNNKDSLNSKEKQHPMPETGANEQAGIEAGGSTSAGVAGTTPASVSSGPEEKPDQPADAWESPQKVLVLLAHPDDPEFFCGATVARWVAAGHQVVYWLLTCGDKGTPDRSLTPEQLCGLRQSEQRAAARVLGVEQVNFLGYPDGYLVADLNLRRDVTRIIRKVRPDVIITCDPQTLYVRDTRLNHPDHRAAGQVTLDAVYPAARDHLNFIELWRDEHLEPHIVREVWVSGTLHPNVVLDVTDTWETKLLALREHKSQVENYEKLAERMRQRHTPDSSPENPRYTEGFRRLILS